MKKEQFCKVPFVMQMDAVECGAACLCMILAYYKKYVSLEDMRVACGVSRDGTKAKHLLAAARYYGMEAVGVRCPARNLFSSALPCILYWQYRHFVVLCGVDRKGNAVINDPERGCVHIPMAQLEADYSGVCLRMQPGEGFAAEGKPRQAGLLTPYVRRIAPMLALVAVQALLVMALQLLQPLLDQRYVDNVLADPDAWLIPFLWVCAAAFALSLAASALQAFCTSRLLMNMTRESTSDFLRHTLSLPLRFFASRSGSDLVSRQNMLADTGVKLLTRIIPMLSSILTLAVSLLLMVRYSPVLALTGVAGLALQMFARRKSARAYDNAMRVVARDEAGHIENTTMMLEAIESIRVASSEKNVFARWGNTEALLHNSQLDCRRILWLNRIDGIITDAMPFLMLFGGAALIIAGQMTAGMLLAFQGVYSRFCGPAGTLSETGGEIHQVKVALERVQDVMDARPDPVAGATRNCAWTGRVEMRDVSFGYAPLEPPFIRHFNLSLLPGQSVALTGPTGSGKTTVASLLAGLYTPGEGEVLFDGVPVGQLEHRSFTGHVSVVDQEVVLFADTIRNNITLWDDSISQEDVEEACRLACIHEEILLRPDGYDTLLSEDGRNLSGGQRQRLEIARALVRKPRILMLDEATSALDARTEQQIVRNLQAANITLIAVAHRLSTIRSCDEIVVMDHGQIVQRGNHDALFSQEGLYRQLVQLE